MKSLDLLRSRSSLDTTSTFGLADLEAVLEASGDVFEVAHAASTGGLSPHRLLGPVNCSIHTTLEPAIFSSAVVGEPGTSNSKDSKRTLPSLGSGVSTGRTGALLDVKRATPATTAQGMRLVL
jgi:hypothetical protein